MQTRRKKQASKTDNIAESQGSAMEDEVMHVVNSESIDHDEPMVEAEASVPEQQLPTTPVKTRRRLSEPKLAPTRSKRIKSKSTAAITHPSPSLQRFIRTPEIPHSALLTPIVWVFDEKYQWWPGKIKPYPPQNNKAKVIRFGHIKPKTLTVDCTESRILAFENPSKEGFRLSCMSSIHTRAFQEAYKEASAEQLNEDEGLPSMNDVLNHLSTISPAPNKPSPKDTVCHKLIKTSSEYMADSSLSIPGELVLAQAERGHYYPGRIQSFNKKTNKYKIELATGHFPSLERKRFFTRYQREFQTCQLGEMVLDEMDENFEDPELESEIIELYPLLYAIIAGTDDEAGRLKAFQQGGKARNQLAQRVGPGDFTKWQYTLINRILQSEFLPDLSTTKQIPRMIGRSPSATGASAKTPMKREGDITFSFSDQKRVHFVTDVLLPETITRLTMRRKNMSYPEADKSVLEGCRPYNTDIYWVDDIMAARDSFLDGSTACIQP
ncbi:hypothetical protein FBU30_008012 [Linnemannia zychae]|nr:hypothetical protein FBU30_008012 [Linnemannia zychae]